MRFDIARQAKRLAAAMIGCLLAAPAAAQVLEIGADGAVTRFDGPSVFTLDGAQSITPALAPTPPGASADAVRRQLSDAANAYVFTLGVPCLWPLSPPTSRHIRSPTLRWPPRRGRTLSIRPTQKVASPVRP